MPIANQARTFGLVAAAYAVSGCVDEPQAAPHPLTELFHTAVAQSYWTWARPPGWEARVMGASPHGAFAEVYVGTEIEDALNAMTELGAWPAGSMIVHEGFDDVEAEGELQHITIMDKRSGSWRFAQFRADGEYVESTKSYCTGCHRHGEDFVRSFTLPVPDDG